MVGGRASGSTGVGYGGVGWTGAQAGEAVRAMNLNRTALSRFSKGKKCLDKDEKGQPAFTGISFGEAGTEDQARGRQS